MYLISNKRYVTKTKHEIGTVKPVNKSHPRGRQNMVFTDKWPLFGGYFY